MTRPFLPLSDEEQKRFWSRVVRLGTDECWIWTSTTDSDGYGKIRVTGKQRAAHRVSWALANGREPDLCVCHSCDNPKCVNPNHLWLGTQADNLRDMIAKGRRRKTHCAHGHELSPDNIYTYSNGRRQCRACLRIKRLNSSRKAA